MFKYTRSLFFLFVIFNFFNCSNKQEKSNIHNLLKEDSLQYFNESIKKNPNNPILYLQRAQQKKQNNNFSGALYDINIALSIDSLQYNIIKFKLDLLKETKQFFELKKYAEKVISYKKNFKEAYYELALLYLAAENYNKVIELANISLTIDVHYALAYYIKGLVYKNIDNYKNAKSNFLTAIEQNPDFYNAHIELGSLYAIHNNPLFISYFNNAIEIENKNPEAYHLKGYYLQENGEFRKAIKTYDEILSFNSNYFDSYYNKGFIYLAHLHNFDSAIYNFSSAIKINPFSYKAIYNRGLSYEKNNMKSLAISDYKKVLKLKPDFDLAAIGLNRIE